MSKIISIKRVQNGFVVAITDEWRNFGVRPDCQQWVVSTVEALGQVVTELAERFMSLEEAQP